LYPSVQRQIEEDAPREWGDKIASEVNFKDEFSPYILFRSRCRRRGPAGGPSGQ
jgi:hypothetical protein